MVKSSQLVSTVNRRQCYLDNVLSTVLKIIDTDGPLPMRNLKPAKRTRTAADRFRETHEAEYEARSNNSGDVVQRVRDHNSAYPKLRDELDKRRSTTKVNAFKMANNGNGCTKSSPDKRRKTAANKNRTFQKKTSKNNTRQCTAKRITKKRPYRKRVIEIYNRSKMAANAARADKMAAKADKMAGVSPRAPCVHKMAATDKRYSNANPSEMDADDDLVTIYSRGRAASRTDGRSDVSLSTYNSYPSTDHEPMVG